MHIKVATMTWRQWHMNWYHAIGEAIFEIYSSACTYLDYCGGHKNSTELTPIFIEHPGDPWTWEDYIPPAAEAVKCLYPTQGWWIRDKPIQDKASSISNPLARMLMPDIFVPKFVVVKFGWLRDSTMIRLPKYKPA